MNECESGFFWDTPYILIWKDEIDALNANKLLSNVRLCKNCCVSTALIAKKVHRNFIFVEVPCWPNYKFDIMENISIVSTIKCTYNHLHNVVFQVYCLKFFGQVLKIMYIYPFVFTLYYLVIQKSSHNFACNVKSIQRGNGILYFVTRSAIFHMRQVFSNSQVYAYNI